MKAKFLTVFMTILMLGTLGFTQDVVSDVGKAAKDTGRVTEKATTKTAHGTVKATKVTAKDTEKAAEKTASATGKAAKTTAHGVKKVFTKI